MCATTAWSVVKKSVLTIPKHLYIAVEPLAQPSTRRISAGLLEVPRLWSPSPSLIPAYWTIFKRCRSTTKKKQQQHWVPDASGTLSQVLQRTTRHGPLISTQLPFFLTPCFSRWFLLCVCVLFVSPGHFGAVTDLCEVRMAAPQGYGKKHSQGLPGDGLPLWPKPQHSSDFGLGSASTADHAQQQNGHVRLAGSI